MEKNIGERDFVTVICIGAGFSGICLGAQMQRTLRRSDLHIYDMFDDFGGTWAVNTYPGAACDVPGAFYSLSFEQNPEWSVPLPPRSEIQPYLVAVAEKYDLRRRTTFRTCCTRVAWDSTTSRWRVSLKNVDSGVEFERECAVLVSGVGIFSEPRDFKDVADFSKFGGKVFHSARWDKTADLRDKNVVVIGNGCTGAQIVPAIAPEARTVTHVVRSSHWILPRPHPKYSPAARWVFRNIPIVQKALRLLIWTYCEVIFSAFYMSKTGKRVRAKLEKVSRDHIEKTAPKEYHSLLIPKFNLGCKRRVMDTGYVECLNRPNVTLVKSPTLTISTDTITTDTGSTYPADIIVLATGFKTDGGTFAQLVHGKDGQTLQSHWNSYKGGGGPGAYENVACSNFPNLFFLLGPNAGTGHTSAVMAIENSTNLVLKLVKPVLDGRKKTVEVKESVERAYVERIQRDLRAMVWNGCHSWYKRDDGWNGSMYPWRQLYYWYRCAFPTWSDWIYA